MPPPIESLRERKRRLTGERIVEAALALFFENGYEATTLNAIAAAADVSRRTVFHHFASKEAIVEGQNMRFGMALRSKAASSLTGTPFEAAIEAILGVIEYTSTKEVLALEQLIQRSPHLLARKPAGWQRNEELLYEGLAARWPAPGQASSLRLAAMAAIGVFRIASETWRADTCKRSRADHIAVLFDQFRGEIAEEEAMS